MLFTRWLKSFYIVLLAVAILLAPSDAVRFSPLHILDIGLTEAQAQQKKPQTLMELLRQRRVKQAKPAAKIRKVQPRRATTKRATTTRTKTKRATTPTRKTAKRKVAAPREPVLAEVEKSENARRVLVVGDFVADGIAQGLETAFSDVANVKIETRANGSSGFVRDDYYDWQDQIATIIEEAKPDIIVVQLGSNDRQVMRVDGTTEEVRTEAWTNEYRRRVEAFVGAIRDTNTLTVWVGAPPYKFSTMSADMLAFNEIYRVAVEAKQGYFVDVWDGFVTEEGQFSVSGSDIKGQTVRLRASDGINFTRSGKRKMAFYVERQLKLLLGDAASPLLTSLAPESLPILKLPPLQTESELERTNPMSVLDPDFDGGAVLLGDMADRIAGSTAPDPNPLQVKSVRQRLVEDGSPPPAQPGRAGNFRWVDPAAETTSSTQLEPQT